MSTICRNGHDKNIVGRYRKNSCKKCSDDSNKKWIKNNIEIRRRIGREWGRRNKESRAKYYRDNKTKWSISSKIRYTKNPKPAIERAILWNKTNKKERVAIYQRWYAKHRKQIVWKYRTWRKENPIKSRERTNKYRKLHPEITKATALHWAHKRRAWKLNVMATLTKKEWEEILAKYGNKCIRCNTTENISMDHIVPLSRGGIHTKENVQPLCRSCNSKKKNRLESELEVA